jgi:hypothetical protein
MRLLLLVGALAWIGCNLQERAIIATGFDLSVSTDDMLVNGCPSFTQKLPPHHDDGGADTFANFASTFFTMYCTRCHGTTVTGSNRNGAPDNYNWDDETSVRAHLSQIRNAVGVLNYMPLSAPFPSCAERERLVQWIDSGAP